MKNDLEIGNDSEATYKLKLKTVVDNFKSEHLDNKTSFTEAIRVLQTALKNITENPHEPRYRRIPCNNIRIQTKLTNLNLGTELLSVAGFRLSDENTSCWLFPNTNDQVALWCLETLEEYYDAVETIDKKSESELKSQGPIARSNATKLKKKFNDEKIKEREHLLFLLEQDRLERDAEMKYVANLQISSPKTAVTTPQSGKFATLADLLPTPTENKSLHQEKDAIQKTTFTNNLGTSTNNTTIRTLYDTLPSSAEDKPKSVVVAVDPLEQHQKAVNELLSKFKEDKKYFFPVSEHKISTPSIQGWIVTGTVIQELGSRLVFLEVKGKPVKTVSGVATGNTPPVQIASGCERSVLEAAADKLENRETKINFNNHNDKETIQKDQCSANEESEKNKLGDNLETNESVSTVSNSEDLAEMSDGRSLFSKRPFLFLNSQRPCLYTLKKIHNERKNRKLKKSSLLIPEKSFEKKIVDSYEATYVSSENNATQEKKNVVIHHSKAIISAEEMVAPYWVSKIRIRKLDKPPPLQVEPPSESS